MILESLIIPLVGDTKELIKSLREVEKEADKSAKAMSGKLGNIVGEMMKIGGAMTVGLTAPMIPIVDDMMTIVNAASDLSETVSKVGVVFGDQADEVLAFGDSAAQALGMSKNEALAAAGTYGNLFVSMGMTTDKSAEMSMGLVSLAADLGSFNNMDSTEVLAKLQSGLTSSTEPLRALGVNINQAMIEQQALNMGLWDGEGALSASAKASATYQLILDQTKTAQGDFARNSEGLANSTKIAQAEFENVKAELGESLLPVMTDLMKHVSGVIKWFSDLDPSVKNTIVVIGGVVAAIGPVITIIGGLITSVGTVVGLFGAGGALATAGSFVTATVLPAIGAGIAAVGWPVLAVIAAIGALIFIFVNFGDEIWAALVSADTAIREFTDGVKQNFVDGLVGGFNAIKNAISEAIDWIRDLGSNLLDLVIPDFLQMHSPPPLATALSMVKDEMKQLSRMDLPDFNHEMNINGSVSPAIKNMKSNNSSIANLIPFLEEIANKKTIDENRLALVLRDAIVQGG